MAIIIMDARHQDAKREQNGEPRQIPESQFGPCSSTTPYYVCRQKNVSDE